MTRLRTVDLLIASGWGDTPPAKIPADVLACADAGFLPPRPIPSHGKTRGKPKQGVPTPCPRCGEICQSFRIARDKHCRKRRKKPVVWHVALGRKLRLTQRRGG